MQAEAHGWGHGADHGLCRNPPSWQIKARLLGSSHICGLTNPYAQSVPRTDHEFILAVAEIARVFFLGLHDDLNARGGPGVSHAIAGTHHVLLRGRGLDLEGHALFTVVVYVDRAEKLLAELKPELEVTRGDLNSIKGRHVEMLTFGAIRSTSRNLTSVEQHAGK